MTTMIGGIIPINPPFPGGPDIPMSEPVPKPRVLSRLALVQIIKHPETWDQQEWHCGTTHCYGGHLDRIIQEYVLNPDYVEQRTLGKVLFHNVQSYLGLREGDFLRITNADNQLEELVDYHDCYFDDDFYFWFEN